MSKDKILMCPPDFFTVDYVINPWMAGHEDSLSLDRAKEQWCELRDKIGEFADIVTIGKITQVCATLYRANLKPTAPILSQTFTGSSSCIAAGIATLDELHQHGCFGDQG